jgi:hypothetical protein
MHWADMNLADWHLTKRHFANRHLVNRHLANRQLAGRHWANKPLVDKHLTNSTLANRHLDNTHLANRHLAIWHLSDRHFTNKQLADRHLINMDLATIHLANRHFTNRHLAKRHFVNMILDNRLTSISLKDNWWIRMGLDVIWPTDIWPTKRLIKTAMPLRFLTSLSLDEMPVGQMVFDQKTLHSKSCLRPINHNLFTLSFPRIKAIRLFGLGMLSSVNSADSDNTADSANHRAGSANTVSWQC